MIEQRDILLQHLALLHTTPMGVIRIKRNLSIEVDDVVVWCRERISKPNSIITRNGKNWYVNVDGCTITVNAHSYTIITAHKN